MVGTRWAMSATLQLFPSFSPVGLRLCFSCLVSRDALQIALYITPNISLLPIHQYGDIIFRNAQGHSNRSAEQRCLDASTCCGRNTRRYNNPKHPVTPDVRQICSKRSWDGQVKKWRRALHEWDPEAGAEDVQFSPKIYGRRKSAGGDRSVRRQVRKMPFNHCRIQHFPQVFAGTIR
eukprot:2141001-Pyramimonas_sp.AAC.1